MAKNQTMKPQPQSKSKPDPRYQPTPKAPTGTMPTPRLPRSGGVNRGTGKGA